MQTPEAIRTAAAEVRATGESYSTHADPAVRVLAEAAVFHASRAQDRAAHDPLFAATHLEAAEVAGSGLLEAVDGAEGEG